MLEKVGVHFNNSYDVVNWFNRWKMPIAVILDQSPDVWRLVKQMSPQTILLGRVTEYEGVRDEGQNWMLAVPKVEAKAAYERIMPMAERMRDIWDFAIQWNEPIIPNGPEGVEAMYRYNDATILLTGSLRAAGIRSAVGGFSEGNPRLSFWYYYAPALRTAMDKGGMAHVHEYDWDHIGATRPWRSFRLSQVIWGNPPEQLTHELDQYNGLPKDLYDDLTWAVTEFGLDRGDGIRKGWKTATGNDPIKYMNQIQEYNWYWTMMEKPASGPNQIPAWSNLAGIAIFCKGPGWPDFNIEGPCFELLADNATPVYYDIGNTTPQPPPPPEPPPVQPKPPTPPDIGPLPTQIRPMVGLHLRNDSGLTPTDHTILQTANIEAIKAMTNMLTEDIINATLNGMAPPVTRDTIVRIYEGGHPGGVSNFVARHAPHLRLLGKAGIHKIEVLNEPNHVAGIEGWGATDAHARDFAAWFALAAPTLREAVPHIEIGFPGLAVPGFVHHDLRWLDICKPVILQHADWLGCHCYWQKGNRTADAWGGRFKAYHDRFPNMPIHITEFGDSTPGLGPMEQAGEISRFYKMIFKYPYLKSAHAFIQSSPDPRWGSLPFSWTHNGEMGPVVDAVGNMERPKLSYTRPNAILPHYLYIGDRLPHHETKTYPLRPLSMIKDIIIHHTGIPASIGANRIAEYHVESKDWAGIGYHFLGGPNQRFRQTNPIDVISNHCYRHNSPSIGIGVRGMFQHNAPPRDQLYQLAYLCADLIRALPDLDPGDIKGHHEMAHNHSNACPGRTWKRREPYWKTRLINMVVSILED